MSSGFLLTSVHMSFLFMNSIQLAKKEIQERESKLEEIQVSAAEAKIKASELKASFENLCGMYICSLLKHMCVCVCTTSMSITDFSLPI